MASCLSNVVKSPGALDPSDVLPDVSTKENTGQVNRSERKLCSEYRKHSPQDDGLQVTSLFVGPVFCLWGLAKQSELCVPLSLHRSRLGGDPTEQWAQPVQECPAHPKDPQDTSCWNHHPGCPYLLIL